MINLVFLGDIVGRTGRNVVKHFLPELKTDNTLIIANVENSAGGFGITQKIYDDFLKHGIDYCTGGNHIWDKDIVATKRDYFSKLVVPANLPKAKETDTVLNFDYNGVPMSVVNLAGRVFMQDDTLDPFTIFDSIYEKQCRGRCVIVDFHAEATSEKAAFAEYTAGRACAVIGTHTHVQTADERILSHGTFFISDAGACNAVNSVLGMTVSGSLSRFSGGQSSRLSVELEGDVRLCGVSLSISKSTLKIVNFCRINKIWER